MGIAAGFLTTPVCIQQCVLLGEQCILPAPAQAFEPFVAHALTHCAAALAGEKLGRGVVVAAFCRCQHAVQHAEIGHCLLRVLIGAFVRVAECGIGVGGNGRERLLCGLVSGVFGCARCQQGDEKPAQTVGNGAQESHQKFHM